MKPIKIICGTLVVSLCLSLAVACGGSGDDEYEGLTNSVIENINAGQQYIVLDHKNSDEDKPEETVLDMYSRGYEVQAAWGRYTDSVYLIFKKIED